MRRIDIGAALGLMALALYVFFETRSYPDSLTPGSPGPAFFPMLLAGLLTVLSVALLVQALRSEDDGAAPALFQWRPLARWAVVFGSVGLFLLVVERADFLLLLLPLLATVMVVMGERSAKTLVLAPAFFVLFVYVVFVRLFGVPFPTVL